MNRSSRAKNLAKDAAAKKPERPKRPRDVNQLGHYLVALSTGQLEKEKPAPTRSEISRVMAALGRRGGQIGGKKRADALSPERRREIALRAARARWDSAD